MDRIILNTVETRNELGEFEQLVNYADGTSSIRRSKLEPHAFIEEAQEALSKIDKMLKMDHDELSMEIKFQNTLETLNAAGFYTRALNEQSNTYVVGRL